MNKILIFLVILALILGCGRRGSQDRQILAKVNNYEIGLQEFEEEFKGSPYAGDNTPQAKREFLKNLINRKLILQDAEKKGLDKDKDFLRMVERFWEQSLLKLALDKKSREIAGITINKEKQNQMMNEWADGLNRNAQIQINDELLNRVK